MVTLRPFRRELQFEVQYCYTITREKHPRILKRKNHVIYSREKIINPLSINSFNFFRRQKVYERKNSFSKEKLKRVFKHFSNKIKEISDNLDFRMRHFDSTIQKRIQEKVFQIFILMISYQKTEILNKSELLTSKFKLLHTLLKLESQSLFGTDK